LSVVSHVTHRSILGHFRLWLRVEALWGVVSLVGGLSLSEGVASLIGSRTLILILRVVTVDSIVHQFLNRLLSLRCQILWDVVRVVKNLPVVGEDLTHVFQVNLNDVALRKDLSNAES
jgi:hypothetical protein